jgi:hypothetical protein
MTTTFRSATEARGASINHVVRYVLAASLVLVIVGMIAVFVLK